MSGWIAEAKILPVLIVAAAIGGALAGIVFGVLCAPEPGTAPIPPATPAETTHVTQGGRLQVVHRQYVRDGGSTMRSLMIIRDQETHIEYLVVEDAGMTRMASSP